MTQLKEIERGGEWKKREEEGRRERDRERVRVQ
jgi:hypothetical protein